MPIEQDLSSLSTAADLYKIEVRLGERLLGELGSAFNQAVTQEERNDEQYLKIHFQFLEQQFTFVETSILVGPFDDAAEASIVFSECLSQSRGRCCWVSNVFLASYSNRSIFMNRALLCWKAIRRLRGVKL